MTRAEICRIVCECLAVITLPPDSIAQQQSEEQSTQQLELHDEDVAALLLCIKGKLSEQQCIAVIGPSDWEQAKTVGQFCGFVFAKHTCD